MGASAHCYPSGSGPAQQSVPVPILDIALWIVDIVVQAPAFLTYQRRFNDQLADRYHVAQLQQALGNPARLIEGLDRALEYAQLAQRLRKPVVAAHDPDVGPHQR